MSRARATPSALSSRSTRPAPSARALAAAARAAPAARFTPLALCAIALAACGRPSDYIRPTVAPGPVGVVNPNAIIYTARLAVGLEPANLVNVPAESCHVLQPPEGRNGELRVQVFDPEQSPVIDLYGERLRTTARPCRCNGAALDRCVQLPPQSARSGS